MTKHVMELQTDSDHSRREALIGSISEFRGVQNKEHNLLHEAYSLLFSKGGSYAWCTHFRRYRFGQQTKTTTKELLDSI